MSYKINGRLVVKVDENFINKLHTEVHKNMAYEYIVNAVKMPGRPLKPGEVVHHKDCNKDNNDPGNLLVFKSSADHTRFHRTGLKDSSLIAVGDGSYRVEETRCLTFTCDHCGKEFKALKSNRKHAHTYCSNECYLKEAAKNIPSKEVLEQLIGKYSLSAIGRQYKVSMNAVKKWCKKYGLVKPKKDKTRALRSKVRPVSL